MNLDEAYIEFNEDCLDYTDHNEANIFNPRINAVVAKVNSFDDIPQKLLDFAHNHSLPILLLGRD